MHTTLTVKLDKKLRDDAKKVARKLGIPLTTVVNAQLAEFVRTGHFEVSLTPRPSKVAEWQALRTYLQQHPEDEIVLKNPQEVRQHFERYLRPSD
jgi:antitoxin component of RelBE/YafQ-DinJ toxin-antitoxin module